jgi:hypothetical protein
VRIYVSILAYYSVVEEEQIRRLEKLVITHESQMKSDSE